MDVDVCGLIFQIALRHPLFQPPGVKILHPHCTQLLFSQCREGYDFAPTRGRTSSGELIEKMSLEQILWSCSKLNHCWLSLMTFQH